MVPGLKFRPLVDFFCIYCLIFPGEPGEELEKNILDDENKVPSDFSDCTTDDDIDLSKLNPAQRRQYLAQRDKRRAEREKRRREKYGDKYDEIMKKRNL